MEIKTFAEKIAEEIRKKLPDSEVVIREVTKNNGVMLTGLSILKAGSNVSPTIYLDDFYKAGEEGLAGLDELADQIIEISERNTPDVDFDISTLMNWEEAKDHIICELVNADNKYLDDAVSQPFLDMAYIYKYLVTDFVDGTGLIKITQQIFENWNISLAELHKTAMKNTEKQRPAVIRDTFGVMMSIYEHNEEMKDSLNVSENIPMYIISNPDILKGAITAFYPGIARRFCEQHHLKEVYVIPSSIHECILFIKTEEADDSEVNNMIAEVNQTLKPEEVLSDHGYKYILKNDSFYII